jgi:preprotein translocase subunit SecG
MIQTVLLVLHLMIAAGLVGVVLLQRSEGGALGIGGGGGGGGFLTGRGTANLLTRVTAALALAFFATSLLLTLLAQSHNAAAPVVGGERAPPATQQSPVTPSVPETPAAPGTGDTGTQPRGGILDRLQPSAPAPK